MQMVLKSQAGRDKEEEKGGDCCGPEEGLVGEAVCQEYKAGCCSKEEGNLYTQCC